MTDPDTPAGKRAVAERVIAPLEAEGLIRPRSATVAEYETFLKRLKDGLAYMATENLDRMVPIIRGLATGRAQNVWPQLATIRNLAWQIEVPPDRSNEILFSWLHSRAGVIAEDAGQLLGTRQFILEFRRPPNGRKNTAGLSHDMATVREFQQSLDLRTETILRDKANGRATQSDLKWLADRNQCEDGLRAIVEAGRRHRIEKAGRDALADSEGEVA